MYNEDKIQCVIKSQDVGDLKDIQLSYLDTTDVSGTKLFNTSAHICMENNDIINNHLCNDNSESVGY